jgi:succinate dehydrogenase / fumarate reductase cytochrome b subunit
VARIVLLAAVGAHVLAAWQVSRQSLAARPIPYARRAVVQADYAVRTMRWGGVIILLFVAYHLLHLTWGTVHPDFQPHDVLPDGSERFHAYQNVVTGFSNPVVSLFYVAANLALGLHLYHGVWSLCQSLGFNHPRYNAWRKHAAAAFAFLVTAGNVSFPIAVLAGVVALPG